jgi:NADP-dependent 3-hydroxy acid dehydrogenase YdfG
LIPVLIRDSDDVLYFVFAGKTSEWRDMMDVNVIAYCVCTREAVSQMRQNEVDDGQIIMINSICGYKVINAKQHHFYTATKHAVTALIEGVKNELQEMKSKIRISSISPEIVKTNFLYTMHKPHGTTHIADAIYKNVDYMEPKDVADACIFILSTPRHVQVHDILMKPV